MAGTLLARKHLSADALVSLVRSSFEKLADPRPGKPTVALADALMSAFAVFALKDPSLLAFDQRRDDDNLYSLYHIDRIPSDTQMRAILDRVPPETLRPVFQDVFRQLQRGKALESFVYLADCYVLSLDGTGYFSSPTIHCPSCMQKEHADGTVTYYHQMLGAALVHPDKAEVIPLAPEPIIKQDGQTKNDCERNAARRFLQRFRQEHPHLPVIVVEDALSANAPHLRDLHEARVHYILGVKEGDHAYLFEEVRQREESGDGVTWVTIEGSDPKVRQVYTIVPGVAVNESNRDLKVTFVRYQEMDDAHNVVRVFTWITDLVVTRANVQKVMRAGRARWKIENETFNTLKNQGYHFEHNYGHGEQHLSVVFALLMMLAFLVDQVQQLCDPLFQAVWLKLGSKRLLWEQLRGLFHDYRLRSLRELYEALYYGCIRPRPHFNSS
jgi:Transposase DDE domain